MVGKKKPSKRKPRKVPVAELVGEVGRAITQQSTLFRASGDQYLCRARLWMELRDGGPSVDIRRFTNQQIVSICRDGRVARWLEDTKGFREWLTSHRDTEERVEATYSQFVEGLEFRRSGMSDKDYLNALKLLGELASKFPQKHENVKVLDADVSKMDDTAREQMLVDTLRRLGYKVEAAAALPSADSPASPGPGQAEDAATAHPSNYMEP